MNGGSPVLSIPSLNETGSSEHNNTVFTAVDTHIITKPAVQSDAGSVTFGFEVSVNATSALIDWALVGVEVSLNGEEWQDAQSVRGYDFVTNEIV
ncbi:MAG: hypothetical protein ACK56I_05905, partial [bacterium]